MSGSVVFTSNCSSELAGEAIADSTLPELVANKLAAVSVDSSLFLCMSGTLLDLVIEKKCEPLVDDEVVDMFTTTTTITICK